MIDYATRYPEEVALPSIETERIAEALVEMFSRVVVTDERLTYYGGPNLLQRSRLLSFQQNDLSISPNE